MEFETNKIIELNKKYGGNLIHRNNLEYAVDKANQEKNIYRRNAFIVRGLVVNHPFLDGNKRTTINVVLDNFKKENYKCDKKKLERGIIKIAKKNVGDVNKIAGRLRRWCLKK